MKKQDPGGSSERYQEQKAAGRERATGVSADEGQGGLPEDETVS